LATASIVVAPSSTTRAVHVKSQHSVTPLLTSANAGTAHPADDTSVAAPTSSSFPAPSPTGTPGASPTCASWDSEVGSKPCSVGSP
jgi:hypothetical protein